MKQLSRFNSLFFAALFLLPNVYCAVPANTIKSKKQAIHRLQKYDYFLTLGMMAYLTAENQGFDSARKMVTDSTVTDLVKKSLLKYTGLKSFRMGSATSSLLAVTGNNIVSWAVGGAKKTARDAHHLKDDDQYKNSSIRSFLLYVMVPEIIKNELIGRGVSKISDSVGIEYPQWIYKNTFFLIVAWHFSEWASNVCASALESVYDYFVPQTRAQQYLQYKKMLAYRNIA